MWLDMKLRCLGRFHLRMSQETITILRFRLAPYDVFETPNSLARMDKLYLIRSLTGPKRATKCVEALVTTVNESSHHTTNDRRLHPGSRVQHQQSSERYHS